jgi:phosphatidylserine decarboxylase
MEISMDEVLRPLEDFSDFNDFFTREIDLSKRPMNKDQRVCVAPSDGKVLAYPSVPRDQTFRIKRGIFTLHEFLQDASLADQYANGSMVVSRLSLRDYHHVHFPDSGIPRKAVAIDGKYYAGGPYSLRTVVPFYTENHRMLTLFDSDHFGRIAIIEVGAFTVGSIEQRYEAGRHVAKGAHKGFFELGGSTDVLLFEKGRIRFDEDLCTKTKAGIETFVRLGDSIGSI